MPEMTLEARIKHRLVKSLELHIPADEILDTTPLFGEGLGLDSVDTIEVVAMLSQYFDIEITDRDSAKTVLANVAAIADYIRATRPQ